MPKLCYYLEPGDRIAATDIKLGEKAGQLSEAPVGSSGGIVTDQHFHFVRPLEVDSVVFKQNERIHELENSNLRALEAWRKDLELMNNEIVRLRARVAYFEGQNIIGTQGAQAIGEPGVAGAIGTPYYGGAASDLDPDMAHLEEVIHPTA